MSDDQVRIAAWNTQWAPVSSWRGKAIHARVAAHAPDIVCLTEAYTGLLPGGHEAEADADYGYPLVPGRRKVTLWSRWPLRSIDRGGNFPFPPGRIVSAVATTLLGDLTLVGVCIPWRDAHVRTGTRDRKAWQDHLSFLAALRLYLAGMSNRTVLLGDFNQRVPPKYQPPSVAKALNEAISPHFRIASAGLCDGQGFPAIDHLALTSDLTARNFALLPASEGQRRLSDHFGWVSDVGLAG